ncbi:MAG: hypothetical protein K6C41_06505 [Lachnospiraceae bacterium]|nr:hypothetical protein [Lachnospiraceae bacterium]
MAEKKTKAAKPKTVKSKKKSSYGQDSKGRYVMLNGVKCYTKEDVEREFKNLSFK